MIKNCKTNRMITFTHDLSTSSPASRLKTDALAPLALISNS